MSEGYFTQHGSVDFYWAKPLSQFNPKTVYVYVEGEYGFIPLIVGKSIEGDTSNHVEIMSENQSIDPFNRMPDMIHPEWTLKQVSRDEVILCITNWLPLVVEADSNPKMWSAAYPFIRDVIVGLKSHGCERLVFFTCMNNLEPEDTTKLHVYDLHNGFPPADDLILAPPAWIFPYLAKKMGLRSSVVCVTQDEGHFIDEKALSLSIEYFKALGLPFSESKAINTVETVKNMESDLSLRRFGFSLDDEGDTMGEWV